jgi:YggT family protein
MQYALITGINWITNLLVFLILVYVILSFFMDPFHPIRRTLDRIVEPMLSPIRQVVPPMGGLDFSPLILWIVIRLVSSLLISLVLSI